MTAKQKANALRFKKSIAEAKKLRAKNPKLTQAQAVKQAWAILYKTGKVAGAKKTATKKAVKKTATKKATAKSYHKDTQSHNVKISVVSGVLKNSYEVLEFYKKTKTTISQLTSVLENVKSRKKELVQKNGLRWYNNFIKEQKKRITAHKKLLTQVKKFI